MFLQRKSTEFGLATRAGVGADKENAPLIYVD
jgi:hypothetical protein